LPQEEVEDVEVVEVATDGLVREVLEEMIQRVMGMDFMERDQN